MWIKEALSNVDEELGEMFLNEEKPSNEQIKVKYFKSFKLILNF